MQGEIGILIAYVILGVIWGFAVNAVVQNKGYDENWFWWGFFFGFIALIVALTKPDNHNYTVYPSSLSPVGYDSEKERILRQGGWKCTCGRVNASYTSLCACGKTKGDVLSRMKPAVNVPAPAPAEGESSMSAIAGEEEIVRLLKEYKELLDAGAITEEEFQNKKRQLLNS